MWTSSEKFTMLDAKLALNLLSRLRIRRRAVCGGTMRFRPRPQEAAAPHTLEWPWWATWVCDKDPAHIEVLAASAESAPLRFK